MFRNKCNATSLPRYVGGVELLSGVGGKAVVSGKVRSVAAPFSVGVIRANPITGGSESDTRLSGGDYSLQDNVFFKGNNKKEDGVQFTDRTVGVGKGSEAVFSSTEEYIGDEVSSCPNDAGFITFSVFCSSKRIKPLGYVGYSAGPLTNNYKTVETNNLTPVIGSPPTHLPGLAYFGPYVAQIVYVASTSGKCFTGSPPYC